MNIPFATIATALLVLAPIARGQAAEPPQATPPTPDRMVLEQRRQETIRQTNDLMVRIRKMNEAMVNQKAPAAYRAMGSELETACGTLGDLQRLMGVHETKLEGDVKPGRLAAVDRVEERLRVAAREMDEAQQSLRYLSLMKERKCDPLPAEEADQVRARNQELAEHVVRVNERLRALREWGEAKDAPVNSREAVRGMVRLHESLRAMAESSDNMRNDSNLNGDRERLREMDRLHDRLHVMLRELEEAAESLPRAFA